MHFFKLVCWVFRKLSPLIFRFSLLIYTISKQSKDEDGENYESVLSTIVNKVFEQSGIRGVLINSRISEVFRKKIFCLQKAVKKASNRGGRQLNTLLSKLETGPPYRFKVYYNEVDVHQLKDENSQLRGEKRKLEESLVQEKAKRLRVDEKAREALEKAEKKGAFYKKKFIQLAKKVIKNGKKEALLRRSLMTILSTTKRELKTN